MTTSLRANANRRAAFLETAREKLVRANAKLRNAHSETIEAEKALADAQAGYDAAEVAYLRAAYDADVAEEETNR